MGFTTAQLKTNTESDPRWTSVITRDATADGRFFYSVKTTGVYCRPSCAARRANPKNVRFHLTCAEAEAAGFRACRRCHPNGPSKPEQYLARIAETCRAIEVSEDTLSLHQLAALAKMSVYHFHRTFRSITGVTPSAYARAKRAERIRIGLSASKSVTQAIYNAGYNASSRFYEQSNRMLGMKPTDYRNGGVRQEIRFAIGECSLGSILVAQSAQGICAILLGDDPGVLARDLQDRFPRANLLGGDDGFEQLVAKVVGFVEAPATGLDLPLDIRGTAFQQRVWQALQNIPPGVTASYTAIASQLGLPKSVRAVAQACGANALAVAIPCHRVVRSDGGLSGYRWGVERKRALLEREVRR